MNTKQRRTALVAAALALTVVAAACGSSKKSDSGAGTTTATTGGSNGSQGSTATTPAPANLSATLNGSGATFPQAYYQAAIDGFTQKNKGVKINYAGGGSGKGRQDLADQIVDFAGSDSPIPDADVAKFKGGEVLYFPTVIAPITVSYNLSGVDKLNLDCATLAGIYQGTITKWNDPAIAALNSGAKLPDTAIVAARRADSSGTTSNFTTFLDKACGSGGDGTWKLKSGSTVEWPASTQAGQGNGGVAQIVKSTPGALGYVDLSDAKAVGLKYASIKNKAGKFVAPTLEAASAAADQATIKDNLTFNASWADGEAAYPITAQTWLLAYKNQTDKSKGQALKAFIAYILGPDGQKLATDTDYAPLPKGLDAKAIAQLDKLQLPS